MNYEIRPGWHGAGREANWQEVKYVLIDGIHVRVLAHHGSVYKLRRAGSDKVLYVSARLSLEVLHGDDSELRHRLTRSQWAIEHTP